MGTGLHKATEDYSDPNRRWHKAKIKPRNFIENIKLQINNTKYEIQTTLFQKTYQNWHTFPTREIFI